MKKAFCVLSLLAIVAVASASVDLRIWTTNVAPTPPITFRATYGPFTPWATGSNASGAFDIHRNYTNSTNLGSVSTPKMTPTGIPAAVEPVFTDPKPGDDVYLWAAFCGPGDVDAASAGVPGWVVPDIRVQGLSLKLATTSTLVLEPHWYQYEVWGTSTARSGMRWADTSDMSGPEVTLVGLGTGSPAATGWYAGTVTERMQTWALDSLYGGSDGYGAGGILLGAIKYVGGYGELRIGLGPNGISTTEGEPVTTLYPGTETTGIDASKQPDMDLRVGPTAEATWIPEPASLMLIGLGILALRRR